MSFDLLFQSGRHEGSEERFDVFAKKMVSVPRPSPLPPERVRAVKALLARVGEKSGSIDFRDGTSVHLGFDDLARGCLVTPDGFGEESAQFLYELLVAGDWVATCGPVILAPSDGCVANAPDDFPRTQIVTSPGEMKAAVAKGLDGFRAMRDAILR